MNSSCCAAAKARGRCSHQGHGRQHALGAQAGRELGLREAGEQEEAPMSREGSQRAAASDVRGPQASWMAQEYSRNIVVGLSSLQVWPHVGFQPYVRMMPKLLAPDKFHFLVQAPVSSKRGVYFMSFMRASTAAKLRSVVFARRCSSSPRDLTPHVGRCSA